VGVGRHCTGSSLVSKQQNTLIGDLVSPDCDWFHCSADVIPQPQQQQQQQQ